MPGKVCLIVNPEAGKRLGYRVSKKVREFLKKNPERSSWRLVFTEPAGEHSAGNLARQAQKEGIKRIVVAGGEGTINQAVQGLILPDDSTSLAIIPVGQANDFAFALGLPKGLKQAEELAFNGEKTISVDLGIVNKMRFINTFSIGFDAQINNKAFRIRPFLRKALRIPQSMPSYILAGMWRLFCGISCPKVRVSGDIKGESRIVLLAVNNGPRYGIFFKIAPSAKVDDGFLDVCLIEGPLGRQGIVLNVLPKVLKGTHNELSQVLTSPVKHLVIEAKRPLEAQIDGEPLDPSDYFEIAVFPKALKVVVPPHSIRSSIFSQNPA